MSEIIEFEKTEKDHLPNASENIAKPISEEEQKKIDEANKIFERENEKQKQCGQEIAAVLAKYGYEYGLNWNLFLTPKTPKK